MQYIPCNGFVSDVAFMQNERPQSAELKFNVGINEVELAGKHCIHPYQLGYSLYDSKWLCNGEEDPFKRIDSYACFPKAGLLIYIVNPQLAYLLASNNKTSLRGYPG